ncbi:MAG: xanthine dehydrogenase [Alphaproteobacteria bacterium]|nr:MAG: xanthine dehydrogenase [Alphaproteobacteria bacterium]
MKFDSAAGQNVIDQGRIVGKSYPRVDGPLKVSGLAPYAHEYHSDAPNAAYGVIVGAGISKGRITAIDTSEAERAPGVVLVMTHRNAPKQFGIGHAPPGGTGPQQDEKDGGGEKPGRHNKPQLQGPEVRHFDQSVAFVVAETFEQARDAARLVRITYAVEKGRFDLAAEKDKGEMPEDTPDSNVGNFDSAFAAAPAKIDVTYTTPDQAHSMMEPHASIARWDGDQLTLWTSHQIIHWGVDGVAGTLGIHKDKVRVISAYIGGGFGSKLMIYGDPILAALAARQLGRPVKVALTRPQIYNHTSHRPATIQRLRLGAGIDGKLLAIGHDVWCGNLPEGEAENAADQTKLLYAGANRLLRTRKTELDLPLGASMRAPGEAVGLLALECAMDELAEKLGLDPIEFRILNDTQFDPEKGPERPFSTRHLVECLRTGADKFGWSKRNPKPGMVRDGRWLIGIGVASAIRNNLVMASGARVRLSGDGVLTIQTQMTDIGTGSYTILAQIGAEMLGLPMDKVRVELGDSSFPQSAGSGGSWGANSASAGLYYACENLRNAIAQRAGFNSTDSQFADGKVSAGGRSRNLADVVGKDGISAEGKVEFGDLTKRFAQAAFGAHFAEVAVDSVTAEVRVRRMLSVCAAGRIINPQTARSQCLGGMTMGIGAALMEDQVVDKRFGYFVNHDLAEYHVPVHADIPDMEVIFLDELDDKSSPIKAKGVGELGICGVGAAVANAVHNATGARIRDYPLTLDKIMAKMAV